MDADDVAAFAIEDNSEQALRTFVKQLGEQSTVVGPEPKQQESSRRGLHPHICIRQ
jgi:hypothetical protein